MKGQAELAEHDTWCLTPLLIRTTESMRAQIDEAQAFAVATAGYTLARCSVIAA